MSKKKGNNNWRSRILAERYRNKRSRERLRSKGETSIKKRSSLKEGPKSGKWAMRIKAEQNRKSITKDWRSKVSPVKARRVKQASPNKKLTKLKGQVQKARRNAQLKGRQAFPSPTIRKSPKLITPRLGGKAIQPVGSKKSLGSLKNQQQVVKAPRQSNPSKPITTGIAKLKSAALKNRPIKAPVKASLTPNKGTAKLRLVNKKAPPVPKTNQKTKATPSKGISLLKKNAIQIANKPKEVKRVKQPVIRRGR